RRARASRRVDPAVGDRLQNALLETVAQRRLPDAFHLERLQGQVRRRAQTDDAGGVLRARATPAFVAAAVDDRFDVDPLADVQRADALGAVEFVRAQGEKVDAELVDAGRDLARR